MSGRRWLLLSVIVPAVGIAALITCAELRYRTGEPFRVAIEGYDPRDLLHGRYLRYRYVWDWHGPHVCGAPPGVDVPRLDSACCVCLTRRGSGEPPAARAMECASLERGSVSCDAWLQSSEVEPPRQYFIPEEKAERLERELFARKAAVDLSVRDSGEAEVGELYLDGQPWRRVVP